MLSQEFVNEMKQRLLEEKRKMEEELGGLPVHTEMGDDQEANADEDAVDMANQDVIGRIKGDLARIEAALERIEAGTYGVDAEGKEISEERLRALPWADKAL